MAMFERPKSAKPRKAEALMRGRLYPLDGLSKELSQFKDNKGNDVYKAVACFTDFKYQFYTFLPKDFDNKDDEYFIDINEHIQAQKPVYMVYYGKIGPSNNIELLKEGEKVDQEKLDGIKLIEEAEKEAAGFQSPKKRFYEDAWNSPTKLSQSDTDSPRKKQKPSDA